MFKRFFGFISNKMKEFVNKIRKSKTVKTVGKLLNLAGSACVVVTAFRMGNIGEAVRTMTKSDVSLIDTAKWFVIMCKDFIPNGSIKNIDWKVWGVRNILLPFIGSIAYCGSKFLKAFAKVFRWIKGHKIVSTAPKAVPVKKKTSVEVVNVF